MKKRTRSQARTARKAPALSGAKGLRAESPPHSIRSPQSSVPSPRWWALVSPTSGLAAGRSERTRFVLFRLLPFLVMAAAFLFLLVSAAAGQDAIRADSATVENRWPRELAFQIAASSDAANITDINVRLQVGAGSLSQIGKVDFTPGRTVKGEYVMRTRGSAFLPVGTDIEYAFEIVDAAGNRLITPKTRMMYLDPRFTWSSLKSAKEPIAAWYYGNGERAAQVSLKAVEESALKMEQKAGMTITRPFKLILYSSREHWREVQNPRSETQERELILLGTAYAEHDLVLVLADPLLGSPADTAAHEATHLLVHFLAGNSIPAWLNEGLAVYSQAKIDPGYLSFLDNAIKQDKLYPLRGLETLPGRPEENIAGYGQSYSVVNFMISTYGPKQMHDVLAALNAGRSIDEALQSVYGFDRDRLDARWRESVGAKAREYDFSAPTPIAVPNLAPMTVPQSPSGQTAGNQTGQTSGVSAANPGSAFMFLGVGLIAVSLLAAAGLTAARRFRKG